MALAHRFIDPKILASLNNLPLLAKAVVDGVLLGLHQTSMPGGGFEFNQYRSYQPGDDLRQLDWKTYARSDRYFVRESDVETSIAVQLLLDASASMNHRDDNGFTKFHYARFLLAALGYLAFHQGDMLGLSVVGDGGVQQLPPRHNHLHLHRVLTRLDNAEAHGHWPGWEQVQGAFHGQGRRQLVIVATDGHERAEEIKTALTQLGGARNEVLVFHIIARNEMDLSYSKQVTLQDLETGKRMVLDSRGRERDHRQRFLTQCNHWRDQLLDGQLSYERLFLDMPLDRALRSYLHRRQVGSGS